MAHRTTGSFAGVSTSATVECRGNRVVRVDLASGQATVLLQRSVDGGTTWVTITQVTANGAAIASGGVSVTTTSGGPCLLRLNDTAHTTATPYVLECTNVVT
jgi:hypothetical protein